MSEQTQSQATGGGIRFGDHASITGDVVGGDKIVKNYFPEEKKRSQIQLYLLEKMKNAWINGVLDHALDRTQPIPLEKELHFRGIDRPKSMVMQFPHPQPQTISSEMKMIDVFNIEEVQQALVILGKPGGGKTVAMLELASSAFELAEKDISQPIPVIANLSSWANSQSPLEDWLESNLYNNFNTHFNIRSCLQESALFVFLDGLDEMNEDVRQKCVSAINDFHERYPGSIAVCCRIDEYYALTTRLHFGGVIEIQAPALQEIDKYLERAGSKLSALRTAIEKEGALQELALVPLTFNIMCAAYEGASFDALLEAQITASFEEQRKHLFDIYVERMFRDRIFRTYDGVVDETESSEDSKDKKQKPPYSQKHTLKWLSWLACSMTQQNYSTLLLEQLQRNWLPRWWQRLLYLIGVGLVMNLLVGLVIVLAFTSISPPTISNLIIEFEIFLLLSLPIQIISMLIALRKIRPVETMQWSWRMYKKSVLWLIPALIILLLLGDFSFILNSKGNYHPWLPTLLVFSPFLFFILLAGGLGKYQGKGKNHPNQGIRQSAKNAGLVGIFVLIGATLPLSLDLINLHIFTLKEEFAAVCVLVIPLAVFATLFFGAFACIQHIVLRFMLALCRYTPLNYIRFLDYATEKVFLYKKGAGYIFIHKLFQEYLAAQSDPHSHPGKKITIRYSETH